MGTAKMELQLHNGYVKTFGGLWEVCVIMQAKIMCTFGRRKAK